VSLPQARPGLVIRYDYLWTREAAAGRWHSERSPPCLIAATDREVEPRFVVILALVLSRPSRDSIGVEIPVRVREALDDAPRWVIVSEHNVDAWPNTGLAHIPGRPGIYAHGFIPPGLFAQVKGRFLELYTKGGSARINRWP
jgi:hypothetical protein